MGISIKLALVRVTTFGVVGAAIIVSTQILRSTDPTETFNRYRQMVQEAVLSLLKAPQATAEGSADENAPAELQSLISPGTDTLQESTTPKTFAAEMIAPPKPEPEPKAVSFASVAADAPRVEVPARCKTPEISSASTMIGDKIQLRFFAKVGMPGLPDDRTSLPKIETVAFERLDLSGVYEVTEDGTVALPLIGRVALAGQSLACTEALVANGVAGMDGSVSAVIASFASRPAVTVGGAVRAPGTYAFTPGMTVNRLLSLAGATFSDAPTTPQEIKALVAQRDEILRRQILAILEHGRLKANLEGRAEIDVRDSVVAEAPDDIVSSLIASETATLQHDISLDRAREARDAVALAGLQKQLEDTRAQLALLDSQIANLQARQDELSALKGRGLLQASQVDVALGSLMELSRLRMQLDSEQSNLALQISLARENARLARQTREQDLSQRATTLLGQISLFDVQRAAITERLNTYEINTAGEEPPSPLSVTIERTNVDKAYLFEASLDTPVFPGDMVSVSLLATNATHNVTARNSVSDETISVATELLHQ